MHSTAVHATVQILFFNSIQFCWILLCNTWSAFRMNLIPIHHATSNQFQNPTPLWFTHSSASAPRDEFFIPTLLYFGRLCCAPCTHAFCTDVHSSVNFSEVCHLYRNWFHIIHIIPVSAFVKCAPTTMAGMLCVIAANGHRYGTSHGHTYIESRLTWQANAHNYHAKGYENNGRALQLADGSMGYHPTLSW